MGNIRRYVKKLPYWNKLSEREKELVEGNASVRTYVKGAVINGYGNRVLGMIYSLRGSARAYKSTEGERNITLFELKKGDTCVLTTSCVIEDMPEEIGIVAESSVELVIVYSDIFEQLMRDNIYVRCFAYELAAKRLASMMWIIKQTQVTHFDQRLATFLVSNFELTDNRKIMMKPAQIAEKMQISEGTIKKMFHWFIMEGTLEEKYGQLFLKDMQKLRNLL